MSSSRPALYASPIQHVLVLQEEDPTETGHPSHVNNTDTHTRKSTTVPENARTSKVVPVTNANSSHVASWRVRDPMTTYQGILVLCLNIGVDPPDVVKPSPCARLECWVEPNAESPKKSSSQIEHALKAQYERWQPQAEYKVAADPTVNEISKLCVNLRRVAKGERVMFHYNGHGVPKPTPNGEIWVFNNNYTQYIPMNFYDLQEVLGSPSLYVFDCNCAGVILRHFKDMMRQFEREYTLASEKAREKLPPPPHRNSIVLAACRADELLPTSPALPADLFTSCLTTPIKTVLRWFASRTLITGITPELIDRLPGYHNKRQTPVGELNWIFTAVTDAIAWNVLPREQFMMLYRQDLLLSSLMRNFLLADRILRTYGCTPQSHPELPQTHDHPLWDNFDLAVEQVLSQLERIVVEDMERQRAASTATAAAVATGEEPDPAALSSQFVPAESTYVPSSFFEDQMTAFDVGLDLGFPPGQPPEQLPVLLQTLLSRGLRVKALQLFSRYMQTGPKAVDYSLSIGVFPYMLQLLKIRAQEVRQELVFIWSKILALDATCATDLVKEKREKCFVEFLTPQGQRLKDDLHPVYIAVALFVLSVVANEYADRCRDVGTIEACHARLMHHSPFVRRWACLCLTVVIRNASVPTQSNILSCDDLIKKITDLAKTDEAPDVRAAAVSTMSAIMGGVFRTLASSGKSQASSQCSRGDYQPSRSRESYVSHRSGDPKHVTELHSPHAPIASNVVWSGNDPEADVNGTDESRGTLTLGQADYYGAPVSEYSEDERDALLKIGVHVAEIGREESSVLVRREVAIAIAKAVPYMEERFTRAAHITDVMGIEDSRKSPPTSDNDRCELVYRKLWTTLSELAYDPHPIVAALARRRYDAIAELLWTHTPAMDVLVKQTPTEIPATDHVFSPNGQSPDSANLGCNSLPFPSAMRQAESRARLGEAARRNAVEVWRKDGTFSNTEAMSSSPNGRNYYSGLDSKSHGARMPPLPCMSGPEARSGTATPLRNSYQPGKSKPPSLRPLDIKAPTETIHVRSTSGSFDLNTSSRLPYISRIPRTHSASLIDVAKPLKIVRESPPLDSCPDVSMPIVEPEDCEVEKKTDDEEGPRSLPHIALAKGVGMLVQTMSKQFNRSGQGTAAQLRRRSEGSCGSCADCNEVNFIDESAKPQFPRRLPKRSLSYQVLNAAKTLVEEEAPLFASSRTTYYADVGASPSQESLHKVARELPRGYDRIYLSGAGDAALSLYEWSSVYIARVEFDATTTDGTHGEEALPRYAAFWDKFIKSRGNIPSESLRAFALLGDRGNGMGVGSCGGEDDDGEAFTSAIELSSYAMGAGGGAVTAMAFLPRDIGCGDDQLVATGDDTGSVGVYDIRTGTCQGSFGIPFPPGIPEVGVSSILCLNPPSPVMRSGVQTPLSNSRSALILAGAYDGRVAVFKSDLHGPKYLIMSTFQASGQSLWSKAGTRRELRHGSTVPRRSNVVCLQSARERAVDFHPRTFEASVRESGNGLFLAFDAESSMLAAGGCDNETVRVWDLSREQCVWEGAAVAKGSYPTAASLWGPIKPNIFVVGSSAGKVNMIDMREKSPFPKARGDRALLGSLDAPVISLGTSPPVGGYPRELVVSADIGGQIAFWDPRWNFLRNSSRTPKPNFSRIQAHRSNLTAMCVHPEGKFIASGSTAKCVKVFGPKRNMLKMICTHESGEGKSEFCRSGARIPPVTSLAFQPESYLLGIGCVDSSVTIFGHPDIFPGFDASISESVCTDPDDMYEYWK